MKEWQREVGSLVLSCALIGGCFAWAAYATPTQPNEPASTRGVKRIVFTLQMMEVSEAEKESEARLSDYHPVIHTPRESLDGDMRCGSVFRLGTSGPANRRYAVKGPRDNADPHLSRTSRDDAPRDAVPVVHVGVRPGAVPTRTRTAPYGRHTSSGTDPISAKGSMWGDEIGDSAGESETPMIASHGGAVKQLIPQALGNDTLRLVHASLKIEGPLKPSQVLSPMNELFPSLRECVMTRSTLETLGGQVDITMKVSPEGRVLDFSVTSAEPWGEALDCMAGLVSTRRFAVQSSSSEIVYPLFLSQAEVPQEVVPPPVSTRATSPTPPCADRKPASWQPCRSVDEGHGAERRRTWR